METLRTQDFGQTREGRTAVLYTMTNGNGMSASVTDYGAALVSLFVPDKNNIKRDIVLGYEDVAGYEAGGASFGAPVGRNANRIAGAAFEINGVSYTLEKNDHKNNLHSGCSYYNKRFWKVEEAAENKIVFSLESSDMDQGYPGALTMRVTYVLTEDNVIVMKYHAVPDADTIINMTNHSYFNLNGHKAGDILEHSLVIDADFFTRADAESIPTGQLLAVDHTPMDFRKEKKLGQQINADYEAIRWGGGYDHNWVLKNQGKFAKVAEAAGNESGVQMEVWTDLPGMQVYTSNFLDKEPGKKGAVYERRGAVCFETQYFPDAIHHENFEGPICKAGETYETVTEYRFKL